MIARWRSRAALYHWPEAQPPGKRGRKPSQGKRPRRLKEWAARSDTPWEEVEVQWYGGQRKKLKVFSRLALGYTPGWAPVAIRFVIVRDPEGQLRDEVFFCTDVHATPAQILAWVVRRWSVEVAVEEARAHLGVETQRQWSDLAMAHTPPILLALMSIVTLLARRLSRDGSIPRASTAWYATDEPTFSDCLTLVRHHLWRARFLVNSTLGAEFVKIPREVFDLMISSLPLAA